MAFAPEHNATHAFFDNVVSLLPHHIFVVIADPEVALVSVGPDLAGVGGDHLPVVLFDAVADFVVGQVAVLLGVLALLAGAVRGAADGVSVGVYLG